MPIINGILSVLSILADMLYINKLHLILLSGVKYLKMTHVYIYISQILGNMWIQSSSYGFKFIMGLQGEGVSFSYLWMDLV